LQPDPQGVLRLADICGGVIALQHQS
jgi:hypothetical protein